MFGLVVSDVVYFKKKGRRYLPVTFVYAEGAYVFVGYWRVGRKDETVKERGFTGFSVAEEEDV